MVIVFAILLFSFLIFIHELGHFVAAKLSGVQVNEFSMFMGPAIWKKKKGDTLYAIRCIPIGGYCAMEGEDADTENPRSFQKAAWWKRLIILLAGSSMNFIAGFLIMVIVFAPAQQFIVPVISSFEEFATVDDGDGLRVGDRILEIDGETVYQQSDFSTFLALNPGDVHDLVVLREGQKVYLDDFEMKKHTVTYEDGSQAQLYGLSFSVEEANFGTKLENAWYSTVNAARMVRISIQMLINGSAGFSDLSGPVGIVDQMSSVASASETWVDALLNVLYFGGIIAVNLAIMNLLPIPALDGGRAVALLLTTGIEKITRKKINPKYEGYIHGVGMVLLLVLMAVIMFKDIFTIFKR